MVAFSPDSKQLAYGGVEQILRVADVPPKLLKPLRKPGLLGDLLDLLDDVVVQPRLEFAGHTGSINDVCWDETGGRLATASNDGSIAVWDACNGRLIRRFRGHAGFVTSVAWQPGRDRLVSTGIDRTVKIWNLREQDALTLQGEPKHEIAAAWSPDEKTLITAGKEVRFWEVATGNVLATHRVHSGRGAGASFSPDGRHVATSGADGSIIVWDAATRIEHRRFRAGVGDRLPLAWSRDSKRLAAASWMGEVQVWHVENDKQLLRWQAHQGESTTPTGHIYQMAWSPVDDALATVSDDRTIKLWNANTGELRRSIDRKESPVTAVAWSPDGRRLATGDVGIHLWDTTSGELIREFETSIDFVSSVSFSPDGRQLVSGGADHAVRIWDVATGRALLTLRGHTAIVMDVDWTASGRRISSLGFDGAVKIWDASLGYADQ